MSSAVAAKEKRLPDSRRLREIAARCQFDSIAQSD
jgi:hypothetical protein